MKWWKRSPTSRFGEKSGDVDYKELEAAENRLKHEQNECVAVLLKTDRAWDNHLMELVGYLNSEGIDSVFTSNPSPYPPTGTFSVMVKPSQLEQAKEALARFQAKSAGSASKP